MILVTELKLIRFKMKNRRKTIKIKKIELPQVYNPLINRYKLVLPLRKTKSKKIFGTKRKVNWWAYWYVLIILLLILFYTLNFLIKYFIK